MNIIMLEHINLKTTRMPEMIIWYEKILGLSEGYRPPFGVVGAWLYRGDWPMIHLLAVDEQKTPDDPQMEHMAFRAQELKSFLEILHEMKIPFKSYRVPELRILQVYISDPDGNNMHIDFPREEADALGL